MGPMPPVSRSQRVLGFLSPSSSLVGTSEESARATSPTSSKMLGTVSLPSLAKASFAFLASFSRKFALFRFPVSGGIRISSRHISTTTFVEVLHFSSIFTSSRRWKRMPSRLFSYGRLLTGDLGCPFVVGVACRAADIDGPAADGEFEVCPGAPQAVLVIAVKPERTVSALAETCPRLVTTAVLMDPRTDDGVLRASRVEDLTEDLDVLQVRCEIQLGAVIRLPRGRRGLWDLRDRLIQDPGLPRRCAGELTDYQIHTRRALVVRRSWRPQDRGGPRLAHVATGPCRESAVHGHGPLHRHRVGEQPIEVPPCGRRADYSRRLGTFFGIAPLVLVEPEAPDCGHGVRCTAVAWLAEEVHADVAVALQLRFFYQVVGGFLSPTGVRPGPLADACQLVTPCIRASEGGLFAGEGDHKTFIFGEDVPEQGILIHHIHQNQPIHPSLRHNAPMWYYAYTATRYVEWKECYLMQRSLYVGSIT